MLLLLLLALPPAKVLDVKSEMIGAERYRFKAEIEFHGEQIVRRLLEREDREELAQAFRFASAMPAEVGLPSICPIADEHLSQSGRGISCSAVRRSAAGQ